MYLDEEMSNVPRSLGALMDQECTLAIQVYPFYYLQVTRTASIYVEFSSSCFETFNIQFYHSFTSKDVSFNDSPRVIHL